MWSASTLRLNAKRRIIRVCLPTPSLRESDVNPFGNVPCDGGPSGAVRGDKEKALVEYIARITLPMGVSSNWKQASKLCW